MSQTCLLSVMKTTLVTPSVAATSKAEEHRGNIGKDGAVIQPFNHSSKGGGLGLEDHAIMLHGKGCCPRGNPFQARVEVCTSVRGHIQRGLITYFRA